MPFGFALLTSLLFFPPPLHWFSVPLWAEQKHARSVFDPRELIKHWSFLSTPTNTTATTITTPTCHHHPDPAPSARCGASVNPPTQCAISNQSICGWGKYMACLFTSNLIFTAICQICTIIVSARLSLFLCCHRLKTQVTSRAFNVCFSIPMWFFHLLNSILISNCISSVPLR